MVQDNGRYAVEQYLLPGELYSSGPALLLRIMQNANREMERLYTKADAEFPGAVFSETHRVYYRENASALIIRVEMPKPGQPLLSRAAFLCYNDKNGENLYFTSELAANGKYLLCCKPDSERIKHIICCDAPEEEQDEFDIVASRYWGMIFDGELRQLESLRAG